MKANHFESVLSPTHYCQFLTLIAIFIAWQAKFSDRSDHSDHMEATLQRSQQ